MPTTLASQIAVLIDLGVCLVCGLWGRGKARGAAGAVAAAIVASLMAQRLSRVWIPTGSLLAIDGLLLLVLVGLAWRPKQAWLPAIAGAQGVILALDLLQTAQPALQSWSYATAVWVATHAVLGVLIWGAVASRRRGKAGLKD